MAAAADGGGGGAGHSTFGSLKIVSVKTRLRNLVSKEKRRFKDEKYDLDLTYINDKIIAMGFPSSDFEASYRNDADDVYNFFEERHKDHYKFYNLCSERAYPKERFHGRVAHFPFDDHNPPPLGMFLYFCQDVEAWLAQDDRNVAAIHCKAGKGRTGVMITAFLMYAKEWEEPEDAMSFYGFARTNNQKGITIPSQRSFIFYWDKILKSTSQFETQAAVARRTSILANASDGVVSPDEKALIKSQVSSLKDDGEMDDTDSEGEGEGGAAAAAAEAAAAAAAVEEQLAQLLSLKEEGHLSQAEYDEAVKHVEAAKQEAAEAGPAAGGSDGGGQTASPPPPPEAGAAGGGEVAAAAAAEAAEDSPDEDEEVDDDDGKSGSGSMIKMMKGFGFGKKKKGLAKTAEVATPKEMEPLMDRAWNDRNRAEPPTRGQIPAPVLKCITMLRIVTTPKGGYEPMFRICCGGFSYDSKDMIPNEFMPDKTDSIEIPVPDIPVIDEVFVTFYRPSGMLGKKKKMLQFWFHVSFVEEDLLSVTKKEMDKAVKDCKKHKKYSEDFRVEIAFKPAPEGTPDPRRNKQPPKMKP